MADVTIHTLTIQDLGPRVLITGGPDTGKTRLSVELAANSVVAREADLLIDPSIPGNWSKVSQELAEVWFQEPGPWIVEGVQVPRAIRKWLAVNPTGCPAETIIWLHTPYRNLTVQQTAMLKGMVKVWAEIKNQLLDRGQRILNLGR